MATIGQALTAPESGWRRIDNTDSNITKTGTWTSLSDVNAWNGSAIYNNVSGSTIKFNFTGTKIRILVYLSYLYQSSVQVNIDGITQSTFTCNLPTNTPNVNQILAFESTNLSDSEHYITITNPSAVYMNVDAFDIDSNGLLKPYNTNYNVLNPSKVKSSISNLLNIGDAIPCRYTALTSGQLGLFSELGNTTTTAMPIPAISSATPDGSFNWIHSGYTIDGKMKLVADRNIQHSISLDTLNANGIVSGEGINVNDRFVNSFGKLSDFVELPTGTGNEVDYSSDGNYMAVAHGTSPFITIYKKSGDTFTKLPNPSILPTGIGNGVAFSSDGNYLSIAHATTPFVTIYKRSGDVFTKLPNPSTLPTNDGYSVAFSNDSRYMTVGHSTTPFITIYKITVGDVFTKIADPSTLPVSVGTKVTFSNNGSYMAVAHNTTPFVTIYKITTGDVFTKLANPATLPPSYGRCVAFSPDNNYMTVGHSATPFITIYKITSGDIFTKLANPSILPSEESDGVSFSSDNKYMAIGHYTSPFLTIYKRDGDTFTKLTNPTTLPTGTGKGVAFSPDNNYLSVTHLTTPFITTYKLDTLETRTTKSIRLLTGGTSATDFDNEWDKIIVNSTLNGNITAGDDNVWNWSGTRTWTSTVGTTSSSNTTRGYASLAYTNAPSGTATSSINPVYSFRPMLIVELPEPLKFLIRYLSNYYSILPMYYNSGTSYKFTDLILANGTTPSSKEIDKFGFDDLTRLTQTCDIGISSMTNNGVLGVGEEFEINLTSNISSIISVEDKQKIIQGKYLIQNGVNDLFSINNGLVNLGTKTPTESLYTASGFSDIALLNGTTFNQTMSMTDNGVVGTGEMFSVDVDTGVVKNINVT